MAVTITMPKLGLTMTEGVVAKWFKKEGDAVKKGDALFDVETDKLTNQVEAECDGILLKIVAGEGSTVPCIGVVGYIGSQGEAVPDTVTASAEVSVPSEGEKKAEVAAKECSDAHRTPATATDGYTLATPAAKELAKKKGVNISAIPPTGPNGSVVLKDVEAFEGGEPAKATGLAAKIAAELGIDISSLGGGRVMSADVLRAALAGEMSPEDTAKPLSGMRKTIARRMSESWQVSPRVCYEMAVDCGGMVSLRQRLKEAFGKKGLKLAYNHIIMKACARALVEFPEVNASVDGDTLLLHSTVNIGLAVGVEGGLLVPNLKNCGFYGLEEIASKTEAMIKDAREGRLPMEALTGGTFTITNIGMYGIRSFSPIINQPELAILGVNAMVDTPVAREGQVVIRPMMNLNLVADHRIVDGVLAAQFFARIVGLLEAPELMLM